ncbi:hypothetical protein KO317_00280 [Candidatus Micrarchaeota archaeon]|nr:hypothetical protein [Candidatus Micrarchaeota archaeon]
MSPEYVQKTEIYMKSINYLVTPANEQQAKIVQQLEDAIQNKDYARAVQLTRQGINTEDNILWVSLTVQTAIKFKELGQYQYAGELLELRAENFREDAKQDRQRLAYETYLEGAIYHLNIRNENRNYLIARECIKKGMQAALKADDLEAYAQIAREAENLTGEGFMDSVLSDVKKVFRDDVLSLKKYTLTEEAVKELVGIIVLFQDKSNKVKFDETFILDDYKVNYFDRLPEEFKPAANQGYSDHKKKSFDDYATHFLVGEERILAEKEEKRKAEEAEAFKYKSIINPFYNHLVAAELEKDTSYIEYIEVDDLIKLKISNDKLKKAIGEFLTQVKRWVYESDSTEQELSKISYAILVIQKLNVSTSRQEMLTILKSETRTIETQLAQE